MIKVSAENDGEGGVKKGHIVYHVGYLMPFNKLLN